MMSQGAGAYQCAAHAWRSEGRRGRLKEGDQAAAGTVNQKCIFNGSDLDGPSRGEVKSGGVAALLGLTLQGRVLLDLVED